MIGSHDNEDDLPRNVQDTALIGDPRNDENTFVGQWQLTMLKFHNKVVDLVADDETLRHGSETVFDAAQRIVRWHYRWIVVHDFLKKIVGEEMLNEVLVTDGYRPEVTRRFYKWRNDPFMPVEFSVAAYRFGHSMSAVVTSSTPWWDACPRSPPTRSTSSPGRFGDSGDRHRSGRSSWRDSSG